MSNNKPNQPPRPSEVLQEFLDYIDACRVECKAAQEAVATEDAKRQDFLHAIEFETNCKARSKIATQEHLSRKRRRAAKDKVLELEKVVAFANSEKNKPFFKAIRGLIREQERVEEYLASERIYKPRGVWRVREILFRGKRTDNGEWVEGYFNGVYIVQWNEKEVADYPMNRTVLVQTMIGIATDTLCQYTGLTDKNDQKIWESDIVRYQFDNDDCPFPNKHTEKIIGRIFYSDWRASFSVTSGRNGSSSMNNDLYKYVRNGNRVEVIGNIYDNPELLKAGDSDEI